MAFHLAYWHYRNQFTKCGRLGCKKCPHGPYWYKYQRSGGKMKKRYIGRQLPEEVIAEMRRLWPGLADRLISHADS